MQSCRMHWPDELPTLETSAHLTDHAVACRVADLEAGVLEDAEREAEQRTLAAANSRLEQQVGASHQHA